MCSLHSYLDFSKESLQIIVLMLRGNLSMSVMLRPCGIVYVRGAVYTLNF